MKRNATNQLRKVKVLFSVLLFGVMMLLGTVSVSAATTKYKGVDYSKVYDFDYYVSHNAYVKKHYANSPKKALKYFVKKGMKKRQQAIESFNVNSYIYGNKDLRRLYKNNYKKYYLHFIKKGYKSEKRVETAVGIKKMKNFAVEYQGTDYSSVYDYNYYIAHNKKIKKKYGVDDLGVLQDFVERGIYIGLRGNSSFNVKSYMAKHPELKKKYGDNYEEYYLYYIKNGDSDDEGDSESSSDDDLDSLPVYGGLTSASTTVKKSTASMQ